MSTELTHWKKLTNPNYLGAYSLQPNESRVVTILEVKREVIVGMEGKREECTVAYLKNEKPMILNSTNSKRIEKIVGTPFIENWKGVEVMIYAEKVKAFGELVDALRIKAVELKQSDLRALFERKKSLIKETDRMSNIERIISENETKSFLQVHKYLNSL